MVCVNKATSLRTPWLCSCLPSYSPTNQPTNQPLISPFTSLFTLHQGFVPVPPPPLQQPLHLLLLLLPPDILGTEGSQILPSSNVISSEGVFLSYLNHIPSYFLLANVFLFKSIHRMSLGLPEMLAETRVVLLASVHSVPPVP